MKNLKTFESFFGLFGKKDKKSEDKTKEVKKRQPFVMPFFSKEDDLLAKKVYNSLKSAIESGDKKVGAIGKYADYKRTITFESNGNKYNIAIQKSSSKRRDTTKLFIGLTKPEYYTLVINNRHYNVSEGICKDIWNLLDKDYSKNWKNKSDIEKDFE